MTGRILTALCVAAAYALAAAPAAAQDAEYRGGGYLTDFSGCDEHGWQNNTQFTARFVPTWSFGRDDAGISLYFGTWAKNYRFPRDFPLNTWMDVTQFTGVGGDGFSYEPDPAPRLRLARPSVPTTIGGDEAELHYLMEFEDFGALEGCTARGELWVRRFE